MTHMSPYWSQLQMMHVLKEVLQRGPSENTATWTGTNQLGPTLESNALALLL